MITYGRAGEQKKPATLAEIANARNVNAEEYTSKPEDLKLQKIMIYRLYAIIRENRFIRRIFQEAIKRTDNISQSQIDDLRSIAVYFSKIDLQQTIEITRELALTKKNLDFSIIVHRLKESAYSKDIFTEINNWSEPAVAQDMIATHSAGSGLAPGPRIYNTYQTEEGDIRDTVKLNFAKESIIGFQKDVEAQQLAKSQREKLNSLKRRTSVQISESVNETRQHKLAQTQTEYKQKINSFGVSKIWTSVMSWFGS